MQRITVILVLGLISALSLSAQVVAVAPVLPILVTSSDGVHADGGQSVELVAEAARRANLTLELLVQPWTRALVTLGQSKNSVLFPLVRTQEREFLYDWIGPVNRVEYWVFALRDRGPYTAKGLTALPQGTWGALANDAAFDFLRDRVPDERLQGAANYSSLAPMFLTGRFDYLAVVPSSFLAELDRLGKPRSTVQALFPLEGVVSDPYSYLVAAKGADPSLVKALRQALAAMVADGTWERIYQKYQSVR
jgi:polar amino acid transport system substrate-binding protein